MVLIPHAVSILTVSLSVFFSALMKEYGAKRWFDMRKREPQAIDPCLECRYQEWGLILSRLDRTMFQTVSLTEMILVLKWLA